MKGIDKMQLLFGPSKQPDTKCKDCSHLIEQWNRGKKYYKCDVYGLSYSEQSDWRLKWPACALYNQPYDGKPIGRVRITAKEPEPEIEGQTSLLDN